MVFFFFFEHRFLANGFFNPCSYEHSTGRESVLEMINAIIVKFPPNVLDEQSQTFFLHLVVRLANDSDDIVRSMSGAAIKKLIGSVSPNALDSILKYTLSWYLGDKQQLWGAAAQVTIFILSRDSN